MPICTFRESSRSQAWSQGAAEWILFNNKFDFIRTQGFGSDSINVSILPGPATRDKMAAAKEIWTPFKFSHAAFRTFRQMLYEFMAVLSHLLMEQTIARSNA